MANESIIIFFSMFIGCSLLGLWGRIKRAGKQGLIISLVAIAAFIVMEFIDLFGFGSYFLGTFGVGGILFIALILAGIIFGVPWGVQKVRSKPKLEAQAVPTKSPTVETEGDRLMKLRKMLAVSARIRQDQMRDTLGLDAKQFNEKIWDWAAEFGFKVDGDYVNIERGNVEGFIAELDKQFGEWQKKAEVKGNKK